MIQGSEVQYLKDCCEEKVGEKISNKFNSYILISNRHIIIRNSPFAMSMEERKKE
jgi:hypothetical protein